MALILAIEPDRRQASRISAIARDELHADVIVADSAERALKEIDSRTPDLILTPQLLSPKDETALDERLRQLDAAGFKVQTLMIPVLSSSKGRSGKKDGLLGRLRRGKDEPSTDGGCDPSVFAAQIREYLDRAAEDRAAHAQRASDGETQPLTAPIRAAAVATAIPADEPVRMEQAARIDEAVVESKPDSAAEPLAPTAFSPAVDPYLPKTDAYVASGEAEADAPEVYTPAPVPYEGSRAGNAVEQEPIAALVTDSTFSSFGEETGFSGSESEPTAPEPVPSIPEPMWIAPEAVGIEQEQAVTLQSAETFEFPAVLEPDDVVEASVAVDTDDALAQSFELDAELPALSEFVEFDDLSIVDMPMVALGEIGDAISAVSPVARIHIEASSETVLDALELLDGPEIPPPFDFAPDLPAVHARVWNEAGTALGDAEPEPSPDDFDFDADLWMPLPLAAVRRWPALEGPNLKAAAVPGFDAPPDEPVEFAPVPKKARKKPLQDEWGLFDPVQCGFAALLAKLDEVTDKDEAAGQPTPTPAA